MEISNVYCNFETLSDIFFKKIATAIVRLIFTARYNKLTPVAT